ncbi:signal recognition particle-docking protein FtsY [Chromobacterium amazonense]|uniref:signal recognition particle-docking protein FtsY n=1 Tax=Chromobacterium amazonense TaxID=1382803 RepID=UPI0008DAA065|nr:signal recognition particle-docking protein FtsY [Chromobacterium amazonense]OHX16846.1 signal recognition particle-docking protein FtsY [Chromobacterium amazonense]
MFSFFKKKPKPVETPQIETPAQPTAAIEDVAPAIPQPAAETPAPSAAAPALVETVAPAAEAATISAPPQHAEETAPLKKMSWTERLKAGLSKTRDKLGKQLAGLFGGGKIDEELYEDLETVLLTADMGMDATVHLLKDVRERVSLKGLKDASELKGALKDSLQDLIGPLQVPLNVEGKKPFVIMMTGVNGAGKTTSIGKLAKYYQSQGKSVLLAAGDTFRAAAREQLIAWGERNNVTVIAQQGGDSAAVCYDAIQAAMARGIDIVLADTAGRLPTQLHLMEEIKKVKRVIQKALPDAPHEVVLVLDANIGQNTVNQVKAFDDALGLTGLILTKLDGTAKGGVIAAIAKQRPIPLRFVGVGESIDDLRPFNSRDYIDALFE